MKYKFPNMLGPYTEWPEGTFDRALRISNHLQSEYWMIEMNGIDSFVRCIQNALIAEKPWTLFPNKDRPTPIDDYFKLVIDRDFKDVIKMLEAHGRPDVARQLETFKAEHDSTAVRAGNATGANQHGGGIADNISNSTDKKREHPHGTSKDYTLRRLARAGRNDLLGRIESGELSANKAAIEAGFRRKPTPLEQVMKLLDKLDPGELRQIVEVCEVKLDAV